MNVGETVQTSALKSTTSYTNLYRLWLTVTLDSQDTVNNTSTLTASVGITSSWGASTCWSGGSPTFNIAIQPNGGSWSQVANATYDTYISKGSGGTNGRDNANNITTIVSKTFTVRHNADGTGTVNVRTVNSPGSNGAYAPAAGTLTLGAQTLPTIPRQSDFTVSPSILQELDIMSITVSKQVNTYTSTVRYRVNSGAWKTLATKSANTSFSDTYANVAARLSGGATTGDVEIQVLTYSGDTQIGSTVTKHIGVLTGTLPFSLYDNRAGVIGATVGREAEGGGFNVYVDSKYTIDGGLSLGGVLKNYIIESVVNADNGYNVYANGLVEMWGKALATSASGNYSVAVTFPKTLASADASVQVTPRGGVWNWESPVGYDGLTTTGMNVVGERTGTNLDHSWYVRGKVNL